VLVKNLTIGSTSWPSLDLSLGRRFFDPTVMPLTSGGSLYSRPSGRFGYSRTMDEYTGFSGLVKPL
jgi:hypothetical protein